MTTHHDDGPTQGTVPALPVRFSWLALLLSVPFLLIANGRHPVPVGAWMSMFLLLVFVRSQPKRLGLPAAWLVMSLTAAFQFRGMTPVPGVFYYLLWATYGFAMVLPFWLDRLTYHRLRGLIAPLVFPCGWVAMEWLVTRFTPYGSWNVLAYSQYENLVLLQVLAVTGIYGISFLITWGASAASGLLPGSRGPRSIFGLGIFAAVMFTVMLGGGLRLTLFAPAAPTARIASLTNIDLDLFDGVEGGARAARSGQITQEGVDRIRSNAQTVLDDLLERAALEAQAGAEIIFWGETNNFAMKNDEPALMALGAEFARRHGVYLGMAPAVYDHTREKPLENKIVLFDPQGEVAFEYWKAIPVPGASAASQMVDEGRIKTVTSAHGRLGAAICFDMDFPAHLMQAGRQAVDIMLVPSNDWPEIDPWHTHMARFRAVEQGFNMVRHTANGLSMATDYQGRVLASMDHYHSDLRNMVAMVPTRGSRTVYSRVGDLFAYLCMVGILVGVVSSRRGKKAIGFSPSDPRAQPTDGLS